MTRSVEAIAHEAYDDIVCLGGSLKNDRALFKAIATLLPPGDIAGDLARIGMSHADEFAVYAEDWANRMDSELEKLGDGSKALADSVPDSSVEIPQ